MINSKKMEFFGEEKPIDGTSRNRTSVSTEYIKSVLSYDETFKIVFSLKSVLAGILKWCVPEYKNLNAQEIKNLIVADPSDPSRAELLNNETSNKAKNKFIFDLLFKSKLPDGFGYRTIAFYIDLEMQRVWRGTKDYKRAIYYAAGKLFNQRLVESDSYDSLIPVYSIWVTQDVPKRIKKLFRHVTLQEIESCDEDTGYYDTQSEDSEGFVDAMNLLHVIYNFVPKSRDDAEVGGGPLPFLWDIFNNNLVTNEIMEYIPTVDRNLISKEVLKMTREEEFDFLKKQLDEDFERAEERGMEKGMEKGREEERQNIASIVNGLKAGKSIEDLVLEGYNISTIRSLQSILNS